MFTIRELREAEIPCLKDFTPPEWNTDLSATFSFHFGQPYFTPFGAETDGMLVGCANALCQGNTGWLGNIIVLPEFRGQGIATALTRRLVDFFRQKGVRHQVLIATSLGQPVYRKVGFESRSHYLFFKREGSTEPEEAAGVRPFADGDDSAVFAIDRQVTGELRQPFLSRYLDEAWVHVSPSGRVDGFYLPKLANGPILAECDTAGLALLRMKLRQGCLTTVAPEENRAAVEFLHAHGFVETSRAPRMSLGPDTAWQPEHVYARGSGFCG